MNWQHVLSWQRLTLPSLLHDSGKVPTNMFWVRLRKYSCIGSRVSINLVSAFGVGHVHQKAASVQKTVSSVWNFVSSDSKTTLLSCMTCLVKASPRCWQSPCQIVPRQIQCELVQLQQELRLSIQMLWHLGQFCEIYLSEDSQLNVLNKGPLEQRAPWTRAMQLRRCDSEYANWTFIYKSLKGWTRCCCKAQSKVLRSLVESLQWYRCCCTQ